MDINEMSGILTKTAIGVFVTSLGWFAGFIIDRTIDNSKKIQQVDNRVTVIESNIIDGDKIFNAFLELAEIKAIIKSKGCYVGNTE